MLGPEAVADPLERLGLVARGEAVGQRREAEVLERGLAFGPLVAVDPDLGRIGEVGADLDEPGSEVGVEHVEVVDADAALLLEEREPAAPRVPAAEHPLELLGGDDGHHAEAAVVLRRVQVRADVVELAVIPTGPVGLLQPQDRDVVVLREASDVATEAVADPLE